MCTTERHHTMDLCRVQYVRETQTLYGSYFRSLEITEWIKLVFSGTLRIILTIFGVFTWQKSYQNPLFSFICVSTHMHAQQL